jgi:hypothetical protein
MTNTKKFLTSAEISASMDEIIKRNSIHLQLTGLTRDTRDLVSAIINGVLERIGADPLSSFHLFSGLMEALLNSLKSNIRFTIFKNELALKLKDVENSEQEIERLLNIIMDTSALRDAMQRYVVPEKIKTLVHTILSLEDRVRVRKATISSLDRDFLLSVREKMKNEDRKISMKIRLYEKELYIRIKNDSPILDIDMGRIEESRQKHFKLFEEGRSSDYFRPEFLDEKESAGFGIAMIDEGFYSMGLNPLEHFTYTQGKTATTVYLTYPLEKLRAGAFSL